MIEGTVKSTAPPRRRSTSCPKLTTVVDGTPRIVEHPPTLVNAQAVTQPLADVGARRLPRDASRRTVASCSTGTRWSTTRSRSWASAASASARSSPCSWARTTTTRSSSRPSRPRRRSTSATSRPSRPGQPRRAGRHRPAPAPGRERHPPRLGASGEQGRHWYVRQHQDQKGSAVDRHDDARRPRRPGASCAPGRWPAGTPARASRRRSPATSGPTTRSSTRSRRSRRPTPTRPSATTRPCWRPSRAGRVTAESGV